MTMPLFHLYHIGFFVLGVLVGAITVSLLKR